MSEFQPLGMPARDFTSHQLREARAEAISLSAKNERLASALSAARERIAELGTQLDAVTRPPVTLGLLTGLPGPAEADVSLGGRHLRLGLHPDLEVAELEVGQRVAVNDQMLVVAALPAPDTGEAVTLDEVLADVDDVATVGESTAVPTARALVTTGSGATRVVRVAGHLDADALRPGDTLAADLRADLVTARIARTSVQQLVVAETPDVSWDDIGGLGPQIQQIRDSLELPFAHPGLYRAYGLQAPKGMLLYGPPGCGKTLIAKAVATSLARSTGAGVHDAAFLNIKGPELLSKFVGETERQIRAIFDQARKVAAEDRPVVIFFDEMEALFRTRGSGVSSDVETMIVPQVLTEIDGVESLNNVVIIGASNREDMIDPAILRPGRFDVKIRIDRPDAAGAQEILAKHLRADLPLDPAELAAAGGHRETAAAAMRRAAVTDLYARTPERAVLELAYASGRRETLYLADFVSGAMLAAIVARAKTAAIKDELAGGDGGLSTERLRAAVAVEAQQNEEITAATAPEAAARVVGHRGEMVRAVRRLTDAITTDRQENA
ncbi:proteasome ATPase [Actinomyces sp. 594]|uniref:proteasome ATPase n=1 Tax=Actinomyces sp. 594 TaxID=2057793 RepID=UPI001C5A3701|nr:proteasome ATPase [Actinomyces sp. 594]MBW3068600.1 proteasome ATPase [Actinomyces sp. 594]